jgi:electron transfer flavoprotein beta subunit
LKIGVCVKQVPDTASKIRVKDDHSGISEENLKFVVSPYDEYAVEEALRTREKAAGSDVTVFTAGPKRAAEALRSALAMGADRAVHVNTDGLPLLDGLATARLLAARVQAAGMELLFTGRQAADDDNAQVSQMIAECLGWPHVTAVSKFELSPDGKRARIERDVDAGAKEVWDVELPAVVGATKGLNEPRYASLKGIMQAKTKPLEEVPAEKLEPVAVGSNYRTPPERPAGKLFKDDPKGAAAQVAKLLREEAKVI